MEEDQQRAIDDKVGRAAHIVENIDVTELASDPPLQILEIVALLSPIVALLFLMKLSPQ